MDIIDTTPDRERAKSLLETVDLRLDSIKLMEDNDARKFASKIIEEYYEVLLELITAVMSLDGYKTRADAVGSHIAAINYMKRYRELGNHEIQLIDDMRKKRISIKYYGRHIDPDFLDRREADIRSVIGKLKAISENKLRA